VTRGAGGVLGAAATIGFTALACAGLGEDFGEDLAEDFDFDCGGAGIKGTNVDSFGAEEGVNGVKEGGGDSGLEMGLDWLVKGAGALGKEVSCSGCGISTGVGSGTV